ncbi:MAG: ComEC/Rec2 family competence protein, partial [Deltaproteobacteria bacterium]|nr:ComEC/Rec2 family competence protein [Deltaproteobacteria bacterium]
MRPLVPVLLYFISGIIFVNASGISYAVTYTGLAASFLLALISLLSVKRPNYFLIAPIFFFLGALSILPSVRPSIPPDHIKNFIEEADSLSGEFSPLGVGAEGIIETPPELVKGKTRFRAEAKRLLKGDEWIGVSGAVSMTVNGEAKLKRGDYVRFISSLKAPSNYGNPGEFDYKGWLSMRSIFVTGFVKDERLITKLGE